MKKLLAWAVVLFSSAVSYNAAAAGNINNGKGLVEKFNCASCHGKDFNSPIDPTYPKLAGQHQDYLAQALISYRRGDGPNGRANAIMVGQVNRPAANGKVEALSNQEIQDIAAYLHGLPGSLVVKK